MSWCSSFHYKDKFNNREVSSNFLYIIMCASALGLITFTLKKKKCFCFNFPYGWQNNYDGCIIKVVVLVTLLLVRLRLMLKREMLCLTIFSQQNFFS